MNRRRSHATILLAFATSAAGCSLGLDASLMQGGPGDAGAGADGKVSTSGSMDGGGEAQSPVSTSTSAVVTSCSSDADCAPAANGAACVTGSHCDPTWHVCMLDVCNVGPCAVASCDVLSKQCQMSTSMGFAISLFTVVAGGVGGATPASSIAAAYPFLFVLTTNGVIAYNVANPTTNVPPMVAVHGVPFIPLALASIGRRVYFVSDVQGSGPTYRQAVAWLDVPGDPFLASLDANEAWIGVQSTDTPALDSALTAPSGRLELVYSASQPLVASLLPPLADSTVLVPAGIASIVGGAAIVATSGADLVTYRYGTSSEHPIFSVVSGADQSSGQATPERNFGSYGATDPSAAFTGGTDGTVLWESAPLALADAGGGIASARLTWLSPIADGGLFDFSVHADVERYTSSSAPTDAVGPVAWLDANTALVLAAARESPDSTSAQVFDRTRGAVVPGIRAIISAAPSSLGVAVSQGFAYVLAQDDPSNARATVYVLAPGCGTPTTTTEPSDGGAPADGGGGGDASIRGDGGGGGTKPSFVTLTPQ
jgi:hypothetical protein